MPNVDSIVHRISRLDALYYHLLLLIGPLGAGKTQVLQTVHEATGYPYLNLSLALSVRLLNLPISQRAAQAERMVSESLTTSTPLLVDNIEALFQPELHLDPLRALKRASRGARLIATWPGLLHSDGLTYAVQEHNEYRYYSARELADIAVVAVPLNDED